MSVDAEAVALLRRPLPPESVSFKVQTNPKEKKGGGFSKGLAVAFIDARSVAARLNAVAPNWEDAYSVPPVGNGLMCALTVNGVTRWDIGYSADITTDMGLKGLYSDAFKRAGVKWEVGAFLYALPKMYLDPNDLKQFGTKWFMPDTCVTKLRAQYGNWLEREGVKHFGDPLGQGDSTDPQGDVETREPEPVDEVPAVPVQERPSLPEFARAAIRAKAKDRYGDAEWAAFLEHYPSAKAQWDHLKAEYAELGGDALALHTNWKALNG